jgi:hypothetical protein
MAAKRAEQTKNNHTSIAKSSQRWAPGGGVYVHSRCTSLVAPPPDSLGAEIGVCLSPSLPIFQLLCVMRIDRGADYQSTHLPICPTAAAVIRSFKLRSRWLASSIIYQDPDGMGRKTSRGKGKMCTRVKSKDMGTRKLLVTSSLFLSIYIFLSSSFRYTQQSYLSICNFFQPFFSCYVK